MSHLDSEVAILPLEQKAGRIVELRKKGMTYAQIARELRVSPRDIARVLRHEFRKDEIAELKRRVEEVEKLGQTFSDRMDHASYALRHALGIAGMKIRCPLCHEFSKLAFDEKAERWVCSKCGKVPF